MLFLIYLVAVNALATTDSLRPARWSRLGIQFEATSEVFQGSQAQLLSASAEIAETITKLQEEHLKAVHKTFLRDHSLVVLFEKTSATDAVFYPPRTLRPENEEWFITVSPGILSSPTYLKIVAHEYFHAVHFALNPGELDWVREGMAQLFEHLVFGGFNTAHVHSSLTQSEHGLEEAFDPSTYIPEKYGNTLLYFYYVNSQCSFDNQFFWGHLLEGASGRSGISRTLAKLASPEAHCRSFESTATAFSVARLVNNFSGYDQSSATSILTVDQRLPTNRDRERRLLANPTDHWRKLSAWRPIRITLPTAMILAPSAPSDVKWFGLENSYPHRVRELTPRDLGRLPSKWDVGFIRAD